MEEQLANLAKLVEELTKHVHHQESRTDKLVDRMKSLLYGEVIHAPGKGVEVQEINNHTMQLLLVKEMSVSS